jgi:hypothetical protein
MNWRIEKKLSVTAVFIAAIFYMVFRSTGANNFFPLLSHQEALAQQPAQEQPATTVEIPLSKGYIDGKIAYFIATDASTEQAVQSITNNTGFPINYAPILAMTPESERGQGYLFLNGAKGEGPNGFQLPVANAVPGDKDYSPIWESNFVSWNDNATARELKSVEEILAAQNNGELTITETNTIVNSPAINMTSGT